MPCLTVVLWKYQGRVAIEDRSRPVAWAASVIGWETRPVLILATGLGFATRPWSFGEIQSPDTTDEVAGVHKYFKFIKEKTKPVSEDYVKSVMKKIHLLIFLSFVFHWAQDVPALYRDRSSLKQFYRLAKNCKLHSTYYHYLNCQHHLIYK